MNSAPSFIKADTNYHLEEGRTTWPFSIARHAETRLMKAGILENLTRCVLYAKDQPKSCRETKKKEIRLLRF
jgi:hypothetical protein